MEEETERLKNVSLTESSQETQRSTASIEIEIEEDFDWNGFEFITKKIGPAGPTEEECLEYYKE